VSLYPIIISLPASPRDVTGDSVADDGVTKLAHESEDKKNDDVLSYIPVQSNVTEFKKKSSLKLNWSLIFFKYSIKNLSILFMFPAVSPYFLGFLSCSVREQSP